MTEFTRERGYMDIEGNQKEQKTENQQLLREKEKKKKKDWSEKDKCHLVKWNRHWIIR